MVQDILTWSKAILSNTPLRWQNLVDHYPQDLLLMAPAQGEWSALECLKHLVDVDRISTSVRLKAFLAGESFPAFNPEDHVAEIASPSALMSEFTHLRQANLRLLEQITEPDLSKEALHAEYGMVTLSQFLHHIAGHDLMHTVQAEQAMMQPLIQGSGAWKINYQAHITK